MKLTPTFAVKAMLLAACSLTTMSIATISPSLPKIAEAFSSPAIKQPSVGLGLQSSSERLTIELLTKMLLGVPALCIALSAPFAGWIVDKGYRRQMLLVSLGLYAVSGMSGLYLPTLASLIIARIGLGMAIAGIMTSAQTLIADYFEGTEREQMMGLQGAFTAGGGVVLIAVAGVLTDSFGWRAPFWLYGASLLLLPFVVWMLPKHSSAVLKNVDASTEQNTAVQSNRMQWQTLWKSNGWSVIAVICITTFIGMGIYYTIPTQLPFFLRGLDVAEASRVGFVISSSTLIGGCVSALMPWIRRVIVLRSFYRLCALSFVAYSIGFGCLAQAQSYDIVLGSALLCGCGVGLLMPVLKLWTMNVASLQQRGKAIGAITSAMFLGQFFSPLLVQPLVAEYGISTLYSVVAVCAFVATVTLYVITRKGQRKDSLSRYNTVQSASNKNRE
jgi:MFS family permease